MKNIKELFLNIAKQYDTADEILQALRSLQSCKEISENEYNTIISNWEDFLQFV